MLPNNDVWRSDNTAEMSVNTNVSLVVSRLITIPLRGHGIAEWFASAITEHADSVITIGYTTSGEG
ncbi:MAG: hypothetical protein AAF802_33000 [Planctomycetota bacterium]